MGKNIISRDVDPIVRRGMSADLYEQAEKKPDVSSNTQVPKKVVKKLSQQEDMHSFFTATSGTPLENVLADTQLVKALQNSGFQVLEELPRSIELLVQIKGIGASKAEKIMSVLNEL